MFSSDNPHHQKTIYISMAVIFISVIAVLQVFIQPVNGYLNITQYCRAFDENFQPIICIIKNGTKTRPNYNPPPPPTQYPILQPGPPGAGGPDFTEDNDDDDEDCSCEVTCVPRIVNQRSLEIPVILTQPNNFLDRKKIDKKVRNKRTTTTSYRCRPCGTECAVSTNRPPTCYCVVPASRSECTCTATCAAFRYYRPNYFQHHFPNREHDSDEDGNCIFSVTALEDWRLGEERPPYVCECKRSKEAQNTLRPDFICVCQRIPIS